MIKRAIISIIFFIFSSCIYTVANAQSFDIESLDGIKTKIKLSHELASGILAISHLKDMIFINDFIDVEEVHILKNKFLQVTYEVRVGSDQNLRHLILLCVNDGKLYQAMHLESYSSYDIDKVQGLYKLKLDLLSDDKKTFKLNINIHNESKSQHDPKTDHNYNKQVILSFDRLRNFFYSDYKNISEYFNVYDPSVEKVSKQYIMGKLPVIILGEHYYCNIKGEWFEMSDNNLFKYTYK